LRTNGRTVRTVELDRASVLGRPDPKLMYDVIVVGLGGMGSATAYQLAGRGKKVLGLELHTPAHDRGSSHGGSRLIRQAYFEAPAYVPLVLRAYELWERLEAETGRDLMTLCGGLMLGLRGSEVLEGSLRSAREHGLPCELLEAEEVKRRFPALVPDRETVALYEGRAGFLRPEATINAHLERALTLGAELHFEEPVLSWETSASEDRVRVETSVATYEAERLVITAGAWAPALLADLSLPLQPERRVIYWFEPEGSTEPFLPGSFPVFIWEPEDGNTFSCFPLLTGECGVKTVFFRAGGVPCTPETLDRQVRDEEIEFIREYLDEYVPSLAGRCLEAAFCMYTNTPDEHFVIDLYPGHRQVSFASPCSGHGYKFASVVAEILADLADDGDTRHPIEMFSSRRFLSIKEQSP
jgi:sarcosine oxidase